MKRSKRKPGHSTKIAKSTFKKPKRPKSVSTLKKTLLSPRDDLSDTFILDNSVIKLERDETVLNNSFCSTVSSQERNEAFHNWLRSRRESLWETQTYWNSRGRTLSQTSADQLPISQSRNESEDTSFDISFSSCASVASRERNEAFHKWLTLHRSAPETMPTFSNQLEKLRWLQEQRNTGIYVVCDLCQKLRYLKDVHDPLEIPDKWFCYMNPDPTQNSCKVARVQIEASKIPELINNKYNAGSVVWGKVIGTPWTPAIVDDDPDIEQFFFAGDENHPDDPTDYHLTFFGKKVERAWCKLSNIKPFAADPDKKLETKYRHFKKRIEEARDQAKQALKMTLINRLKRFSFISRWFK